MSGRLDFEYGFNSHNAQPIEPDTPMRVYFLGDFSGSQSAVEHNTVNKIIKIDVDNFDDVMTKLCPSVSLPSGHLLVFNELEDFHPDSLFEHSVFKNLRRLKKELANSASAEQASQEIMTSFQLSTESVQATDDKAGTPTAVEGSDDMFERLLGQKQSSPAVAATSAPQAKGQIDNFLADLLSSHIIKDAKPEHQSLMVFIDSALEELMYSILHAKEFQALESAWLSVRDVLFNEEYADENQFFYLINTDSAALKSAVAGDVSLATKFSQHIKNTDVNTYDVLIGNYQFCADNNDITALNYLASLAETLKCQFVSAAGDSLIDADATSLWHAFRKTPQAKHVALTYPKVLLRIPYGEKHEEVDGFAFEEFRHTHQHNQLLWGNSAFTCARLLIRKYHGLVAYDTHITERSAFVYEEDDEQKLYPCAEYLLSEQQLIDIRKKGISPFASYRNKNNIRLFGDEVKAVNA
ncbi:MAG: type VI secretion system contractile sheath large subunit [Paraglaciecola sp.]|nr:type VI secretion system contractile sheath large subunit [Paraglaciecola sp.]